MLRKLQIAFHFFNYRFRNFANRREFELWQNNKIQKHLQWVFDNSEFYNDFYAGYNLEKFNELPLINREIFMDNFDSVNTVGMLKTQALELALANERLDYEQTQSGLSVGLSSGTSGTDRGLFLAAPKERVEWAGAILAKVLPSLNKARIALFLRANSNLYSSIGSSIISFEYYDLSTPISGHIKLLNKFKPTILAAPPSILRLLGNAYVAKQLKIKLIKIIAVAEVLDPLDEAILKEQFQQDIIHQIYQATEGFLATTCKLGKIHLNEDVVFIEKEYLDSKKKKFIPIITDFRRKAQPIIRYRLNDILTEDGLACECGSVFTVIKSIEGRETDMFTFKEQETTVVQIFPSEIRNAILRHNQNLINYQVIQINQSFVRVAIEPFDEDIKKLLQTNLVQLWQRYNIVEPKLEFIPYNFTAGPTKLRRIVNLLHL